MRDYSFLETMPDEESRRLAMRELVKSDLYFLCRYVLNYVDLEESTDIHYRLCDELDMNPRRLLVLIFRGAFKTSIGEAKVIQWLCNDPGAMIGVGSDTKDRAEERVMDIKTILEKNETLKWLFPEIFYQNPEQESPVWRNDGFDVRLPEGAALKGGFRVRSVNAFGIDPLPTGAHYTHVLLDDIENDYNQRNDAQIEKLNHNLGMFTPIPHPSAPIVMLGTIYSKHGPNTLYQKKWRTIRIPIQDRYGKPTFPKKFPLEAIELKRSECTSEWQWLGQFMLQAADRDDKFLYPFRGVKFNYVPVFNEKIHRNGHEIPLNECQIYLTVDPSGGADAAAGRKNPKLDKVGWCVNAVSLDGRWCFLELTKEYLGTDEFLDKLFELHARWQPYVIGIEKMPHLERTIIMEMIKRGVTLPLSELKPARRKKADRIRGLLPLLPNIDFADSLMGSESTLQSWHTAMEHGDDDWDAAAYMIDVVAKPDKDDIKLQRFEARTADETKRIEELNPIARKEWERYHEMEKRAMSPSYRDSMEFEDELAEFYGEAF